MRCTQFTNRAPSCVQTIALCKEAVSGWAQYSMQGRQTALGAAKLAMDSADTCHKELMAVFKTHQ